MMKVERLRGHDLLYLRHGYQCTTCQNVVIITSVSVLVVMLLMCSVVWRLSDCVLVTSTHRHGLYQLV